MRFATCTGIRVHLLLGALLAGVSLNLHAQQGSIAGKVSDAATAVSYTHLTLPTNREV